jgi:Arc/MetJ-type ribon-helix-helix transcriptional regulator
MARKLTTTVRLDRVDAEALERARKDGLSASELIRHGLRVVAARYYRGRRPPTTRLLFVSDSKLGDESALFRAVEISARFASSRALRKTSSARRKGRG